MGIPNSFELPIEPRIEVVPLILTREPRLKFTDSEIISLVYFVKEEMPKQPRLIITCDRGNGLGSKVYDGLAIASFSFYFAGMSISLDLRPPTRLDLTSHQTSHPSGRVISYIEVPIESFPKAQYIDFRDRIVRAQRRTPYKLFVDQGPSPSA